MSTRAAWTIGMLLMAVFVAGIVGGSLGSIEPLIAIILALAGLTVIWGPRKHKH